jgi:AraC family transcriptional regulator, regulatory protein of adaptative response / methylated-DNA-[protein]-cysteine methyltransferase
MRMFRVASARPQANLDPAIETRTAMQPSDRNSEPYHFRVVARAIAAIAGAGPEQVPLARLAREAGLSEAHFQRVFSRWAGVSPKRFAQYLALDTARRLLAERRSVLDAAWDVGLSGPGRLHDLFVTWEAMTPGAYARAGEGLEIAWARLETPFGPAVATATGRGLCGLGFAAATGEAAALADLARRWPRAQLREDAAAVAPHAAGIFERGSRPRLHLFGGPFQLKVWEALLQVGPGRVTTYSDLAAAIGRAGAARAVGTAVGRNPVAWIIPCHRVLRHEGGLGGYHWGCEVKRAMLACEAGRAEAGEADAHAVASAGSAAGATSPV